MAGLIGDVDLPPVRWPPQLAGPMHRLGLARLVPRTGRGLDTELTAAEQVARRGPCRQLAFGQLLVDLINEGTFGSLCGDADRVRLEVELIRGDRVVGACKVADHWELVAQQLAGAPLRRSLPRADGAPGSERTMPDRLKDSGIAHAVSLGAALAVSVHPLGVAAGLGTRLVQARLHAGREQAGALQRLGWDLRALRAQAQGEVEHLRRDGAHDQDDRQAAGSRGQPLAWPFIRRFTERVFAEDRIAVEDEYVPGTTKARGAGQHHDSRSAGLDRHSPFLGEGVSGQCARGRGGRGDRTDRHDVRRRRPGAPRASRRAGGLRA
jgi:hypothetical protein